MQAEVISAMNALGSAILILTALWHGLATWHFGFHPARTLAVTTSERPVSPIAMELFRFLAGLNLALVALALLSLTQPPGARLVAFAVLALANATQLLLDARVRRLGLAHGALFAQILAGDAVFTAANGAAAMIVLATA